MPTIILKSNQFERDRCADMASLPDFVDGVDIRDIKYRRGFVVSDQIEKRSILFLGLNPSFPRAAPKMVNILGKRDKGYNPFPQYLVDDSTLHRHFTRECQISREFFFKRVSHLDLLFLRETDHTVIKKILYSKDPACQKFVRKQIALVEDIVRAAEPQIIVVENPVTRAAFFEFGILGFKPDRRDAPYGWSEEFGVDFLNIDRRAVPVIFTGMLSVLNEGSYVTLMWQIRKLMYNQKARLLRI